MIFMCLLTMSITPWTLGTLVLHLNACIEFARLRSHPFWGVLRAFDSHQGDAFLKDEMK